ncbi:uncharacterized protein METZ01_LOCUS195668 [marine metagenome]|uniref:Uncharacterized protein n=1 Tax=marine metagenome TaxID=408172 RepID=A0A382DY45_9ZZZZ
MVIRTDIDRMEARGSGHQYRTVDLHAIFSSNNEIRIQ